MHLEELASAVHHALINSLIDSGAAPQVDDLAPQLTVSKAEAESALRWLNDNHGLVLHPDRCDPWIVHPFALSPTHTWVQSGDHGWWAPCMWCALGIIHLVGGSGCIHTRLGGECESIDINIENGKPVSEQLWVHFALPIHSAWNNVHHYCAMVLPFRTPTQVRQWSERHRLPLGEVVPIVQVSELARLWYGQHAAKNWKKWTGAQAAEIFQRVGLTAPFWRIEKDKGAF